jgi:hypothetical protein
MWPCVPLAATVIIGTAGKAVDRVEQRVEMMSDDKKRYGLHRGCSLFTGA